MGRKAGSQERVLLPDGWLDDRDDATPPDEGDVDDAESYEATLSGG